MLSTCCEKVSNQSCGIIVFTDTERLQVVNADVVAEKVDQSILEHASVTVAERKVSSCNGCESTSIQAVTQIAAVSMLRNSSELPPEKSR